MAARTLSPHELITRCDPASLDDDLDAVEHATVACLWNVVMCAAKEPETLEEYAYFLRLLPRVAGLRVLREQREQRDMDRVR